MFHDNSESVDGPLISLRALALTLTLSPAGGGIPRSEGEGFPFLLAIDRSPSVSANVPQGHERPSNSGNSKEKESLDSHDFLC